MTIVVAAASPDGIVLAADSRTTISDGARHRISSDSADKVFELTERFGVATYGIAFIGSRTINGLMDEFVASSDDEWADVETFAHALGDFFNGRFVAEYGDIDTSEGWPLGFIVVGYDSAGIGHAWEISVPGPTVTDTTLNTTEGGTLWRGQTDVIGRLIKGVDWNTLEAAGVKLDDDARKALGQLEYILLHPITLQDAVDMAAFLVRTTIEMQRFSDGTPFSPGLIPGCGGETQMLAVTRSGVEWVAKRWILQPGRPGYAEGSPSM
jgi:hypothetical protein